jgi:hypothetical protein
VARVAGEDAAHPVTATDVVDELGIARRTAHNKLNALVERGTLDTRKIGARGRVCWTPEPDDADTLNAEELRGDPSTTLADENAESDPRADANADTADDSGPNVTDYPQGYEFWRERNEATSGADWRTLC